MLSAIGETPVSSLEDDINVDAAIALNILRATSRQVQTRGLYSNTEKGYRITPNTYGEIVLPANVIEADEIRPTRNVHRDLVVRGTRLYDRRGHTYKIDEPVFVDMVLNLPFNQLPEATRNYITIRAARIFHDRVMGDEATHMFTKEDEFEARSAFRNAEIKTKGANFLRNRHSGSILLRRHRSPMRISSGR